MLPNTFQNEEMKLKVWSNEVMILAATIYLRIIYYQILEMLHRVWIWILKKKD